MPQWTQGYSNRVTKDYHDPVYVMILCRSIEITSSSLSADVSISTTSIVIDDTNEAVDLTAGVPSDIIMFDADGFEMCQAINVSQAAGNYTITVSQRGDYGTNAKAFNRDGVIAVINDIYSTGPVSGLTANYRNGWAAMPSGGGVTIDPNTGRTNARAVTFPVQDHKQEVTRALKSSPVIGEFAIVMGGYRGMPWDQYSFLHVGRISGVNIIDGLVYEFEIGTAEYRLNRKLFDFLETYSGTLTGAMNSTQTTLPCDETLIPVGVDHQMHADGYYAAYYALVGSEYMKIDLNSGLSDPTITRGQLGSTAATHSQGAAITLVFVVEDNPIDTLLGLMLSRGSGMRESVATDGAYKYAWGEQLADADFGDVGLYYFAAEVNVDSFEDVRDTWFPDYVTRLMIDRRESIKPFIENHILRPFGLNMHPDKTGRMRLSIMRPELLDDPHTLDEGEIIGVPAMSFDNSEIINDVTVNYDYDHVAREYDSTIHVIDETSRVTYETVGSVTLDARGVDAAHRSETLAPRLARKKRRGMADPNPSTTLSVLFSNAGVDVGDVVNVTHAGIVDIKNGVRGVTARPMYVVGRSPDWSQGRLELDVIDANHYGKRYGLIAPSGQVDYGSATTEQKRKYAFVGATGTNLLNSGTEEGYLIT